MTKLPPGYLPPTRDEAMQRATEMLSAEILAFERPSGTAEPAQREPILAQPYRCADPSSLPPRSPLLGTHLWRGFLSGLIGAGGIGKTALFNAEILELVTGRPIFHPPRKPLNVWLWSLEDAYDEAQRRFEAARQHYGVPPEEVNGRLYINSGRRTPLKLVTVVRGVLTIDEAAIPEIIATMKDRKIDVLSIDPLRNAHLVPENDNTAMGVVCDQLIRIADETNAAVEASHHIRKQPGNENYEMSVDDARGGGAIGNAMRALRMVQRMSKDEALMAGVDQNKRWKYFRIDNGKLNVAPPPDKAQWAQLLSVDLNNAMDDRPADNVQVAAKWDMPGAFAGLSERHLADVQASMGQTLYAAAPQAPDWLGHLVARITKIDVDEPHGRKRVTDIIKTWEKNGAIHRVEDRNTAKGRSRQAYRKGDV